MESIIRYVLLRRPKLEVVEPLLKALQENGIGIPQVVSHFIQEKAGENMTEPVAELLVALGSGNLMPAELKQVQYEESRSDPSRRAIARFVSLARTHKLEEALKEKEVRPLPQFFDIVHELIICFISEP